MHLHTPGSADYHDTNASLLDILRRAEARGADIIALTDHNTVRGIELLRNEIESLELLESLDRITQDEQAMLNEYRRLLDQITVLPGFEFTATFGFHILAIFPEQTTIRHLEHTLLELNIPADQLDQGSSEVGATSDVLTAYEVLHDAGALVIPAHVNSTHGVAMQRLPFGGQTRIAWTQDTHIDALEATDFENTSRRSTSKFFNGSKPDYPRRMHIIQGSDAHRLTRNPDNQREFGVCDRMTEVQLKSPTFEELTNLFRSENFNRVRPYRPSKDPYDFVRTARTEGESIIQAFHEQPGKRRGRLNPVVRDVVALANSHGGTVFVGLSANSDDPVLGVKDAATVVQHIREDIARHITPPISATIDIASTAGKQVIVVAVSDGPDKPYAVAPGNIFIRHEGETTLALRDEIVDLVKTGLGKSWSTEADQSRTEEPFTFTPGAASRGSKSFADNGKQSAQPAKTESMIPEEPPAQEQSIPRTGVEIVESVERDGVTYHSMRDLRNMKIVHNVSRDSARKLWRYAILQKEQHPCKPSDVVWQNGHGFWKAYKPRGAAVRFNLVQRDGNDLRVFYGVTEDGLDSVWRETIPEKYLVS